MTPPLPDTFETFDLLPAGSTRGSVRRAAQSDGRLGPQFSRQLDHRAVREYQVEIPHASRADVRRFLDIYNRSRFGVLPVLLEHEDDGQVAVTIEEWHWRQLSATDAELRCLLVEALA